MEKCERFIVIGHVQGVFFRVSTKKKANELGIKGFVRNRSDGSVEVFAKGKYIEEFYAWLKVGPSSSRVDHVERSQSQEIIKEPFSIE